MKQRKEFRLIRKFLLAETILSNSLEKHVQEIGRKRLSLLDSFPIWDLSLC